MQDDELMLAGKYGAIWPQGPDAYFVLLTSSRVARKHGIDLTEGDETGLTVSGTAALAWVKRLGVPRDPAKQLAYWERTTAVSNRSEGVAS